MIYYTTVTPIPHRTPFPSVILHIALFSIIHFHQLGVWPVVDVVFSLVFVQIALVDLIRSLSIQYTTVMGHRCGLCILLVEAFAD
jgi:hypothetical protein